MLVSLATTGMLSASDQAAAGRRFEITRIQHEMGLSHSTIYTIRQGPRGFLWFGTQNGLNRFDGFQTTVYQHRPEDPNSLRNNSVSSMEFDSHGILWLGIWGGGLNRFDPDTETFTHFFHQAEDPRSLSSDLVQTVFRDSRDRIWVGTNKGGLNLFHPETGRFTRFVHDEQDPRSLSHNRVWSIAEDLNGVIWVATTDGLNRLDDDGRFTTFRADQRDRFSIRDNKVRALLVAENGLMWIGTEKGLDLFDPVKGRTLRYLEEEERDHPLSDAVITALYQDRNQSVWAGTILHGLFRRQTDPTGAAQSWERFSHSPFDLQSLSQNDIRAVLHDSSGVYWVGTRTGGLNKMRPTKFFHHRIATFSPSDLIHNRVNALAVDNRDQVWIGSVGGLIQWDFKRGKHRFFTHQPDDPTSLCDNRIYALHPDHRGHIWIGTFERGISVLNPKTGKMERQLGLDHLPAGTVRSILEDHDRLIWIASTGGLVRFMPTTDKIRVYLPDEGNPESLGGTGCNDLVEDGSGRLWISTIGGGLNRLDQDRRSFTRFQHNPNDPNSISQDFVRPLYLDRKNRLWAGTYGNGLNRLDNIDSDPEDAVFIHYGTRDGLPNDNIYAVMEEGDFIWLSTEQSVTRLDPDTEEVRIYDRYDGLIDSGFTALTSARDSKGRVFFGGNKGFNSFLPWQIIDNPSPPRLVLTDFLIFNEPVPLPEPTHSTEHITINYNDSVISFQFSALDFNAPEKNRYAYQLEGFDRDWVTVANLPEATYTNLDPGHYQFMVRAANNDGVWNEQGIAVNLTVVPPPWAKWWAYCIYAAILVSIIWAWQRHQNRKLALERMVVESLQRHDRLKDEFLANTSHELRTPLNGIIGIVESLIAGAGGELTAATRKNLHMVAASGRRLSNLVNDILDFSKLQSSELQLNRRAIELHPCIETVFGVTQSLVGQKDLQLLNEVPRDLPPVWGDEDRLLQIFYNLIGNAIKFTESGFVRVTARLQDGRIVVAVADSGIGIDPEQQERIFESFAQADGSISREYGGTGLGLTIASSLIAMHQGRLLLTSELGRGATFRFDLPLSQAENPSTNEAEPSSPPALAQNITLPGLDLKIPQPQDGQGARLLLVDDDPINLQVLVNHLALHNYQLHLARNGEEALAVFKEETPIDLVLLDVMMPKMSGYEVCQTLRRTYDAGRLPIILLTAKNQTPDLVRGFAAGANDYLYKPVTSEELLARISVHLELLEKTRALQATNLDLEHKVTQRTADLSNKNKELEILEQMVREINREVDLDAVLTTLLHQARRLLPHTSRGAFYLAQPDVDEQQVFDMVADAEYHIPSHYKRLTEPQIRGEFMVNAEELMGGVYLIQPREARNDPASRVVMDVQINDRVEGFLVLENMRQKDAFAHNDIMKLHHLREHAISAVTKARFLAELQKKNQQILDAQERLLEAAHDAGMAEIAANLLHNVGNAMASVKTSVSVLNDMIGQNQALRFYRRMVDLFREQQQAGTLAEFFQSERATMVTQAWDRIEDTWQKQTTQFEEELTRLGRNLAGIDNIVESQRQYANAPETFNEVDLNGIINNVLQFQKRNLDAAEIQVIRDFEELPELPLQKGKLTKVLVHLIDNAIDASLAQGGERTLTLRTRLLKDQGVRLEVIDKGAGIPKEHVSRIFTQGFSTKAGNSGYGLHYCANAIQEMRGRIDVKSEGTGKGACFIVDFSLAA
ncbi:response regulator [Acanthopleuribacter pedis]|uniref:histidine kinase n=1 Tax=Acanthopleuribacter pedis TaxID=442870 RepID=A0A8J7QGT7_9BACT|nr:ATP-binding protein [Acanthopleuribacter pedis]MBO1319880.1 response regulator [Acanthopleuribacter pedis]